jgi:DNA-binding transcriptional LysR family regulator
VELRLLHTFAAVAELRHFARAADRCHLSQPAVSHQIRLLEEELGAPLLNRGGRRVSLTVAGELLLEDARRILAAVERARERVQGTSTGALGRVRLGATETAGLYVLPAILDRFRRAHPHFGLTFTIGPEAELLEQVAANDLDMAVIAGGGVPGELQARVLGPDELVLIAPVGSRAATGRRVKAGDLRGEAWVLREAGSDTRRQLDAWFRRHRLTPSRALTLHGPDAVRRAAVAGLGIALVSRTVVAGDLEAGRLLEVRVTPAIAPRDLLLVDHPHKHHGAACSAMLQLLAEDARGRGGTAATSKPVRRAPHRRTNRP